MVHKKKIPLRMCAGCGERKPKQELIRVVKAPSPKEDGEQTAGPGEISFDDTGRKPGRGAYLCRNTQCLKAARKARRLERALSCQIPAQVYDQLEEEMEKNAAKP